LSSVPLPLVGSKIIWIVLYACEGEESVEGA